MGPNSVYRRAQAPNSNSTTLKSSQHSRIGTTAPTRQINKSNVNATNGTGTRPTSRDDERRPPKRQRVDKGSKLPPKTPVRAPREPEACQDEEDDDDEDEDDEEEEEVPQSKGTGKRISLVTSALEAVISRGIQKGIEDEELKSLSTGAPGLMRASKYYVRAIDMFMSITYLVSWVMVKSKRFRKHLPDVDGLDIGTTQLSKPEEDRMLANYKSLIAYCPVIDTFFKFAERLRSYHEYDVILREMDSEVSAVRSSDINRLAYEIPSWLMPNPYVDLLSNPLPPSDKSVRGLSSVDICKLFAPVEYFSMAFLSTANDSEKVVTDMRDRTIELRSDELPNFLYNLEMRKDAMAADDDYETGIHEGHLVYRTARCLFTGKKSVMVEPPAPRGWCVARILELKTNPQVIAYCEVLVYLALCKEVGWIQVDGNFDLRSFYYNVIDGFKIEEDEDINDLKDEGDWRTVVIGNFNKRVYGSEAGLGQAAKTREDPREESGVSKMKQKRQRAAEKRKQKESEAATSNDAANNPKERPRASNGSNVPPRRRATSRLSPSFSDNPNFEGGDDELGGGDDDEGGEDDDEGGEDDDEGGEDDDEGGEDDDEGGDDDEEGGYLPTPQWEVYNSPDDEE